MRKNSILEIFSNSTITFRNSFWGLLATYWFALVVFCLISWIIGKYYAIPWDLTHPWETLSVLPLFSVKLSVILGLLFYLGGFILSVWQILVVKNNLFYGENRLVESLKQAFSKTILIIFCTLIISVFFIPVIYLLKDVLHVYIRFFPVIMLFCIPPFIIFYFGLILEEGKLKDIVFNSFVLAISSYFKTLFALLMFIIAEILLGIIFWVLFSLLKMTVVFLSVLVFIIMVCGPVMYIILHGFSVVYFVETYYAFAIDREGIPEEKNKDVKTVLSVDKAKENVRNEKAPFESEVPLGMHPLGEDIQTSENTNTPNRNS